VEANHSLEHLVARRTVRPEPARWLPLALELARSEAPGAAGAARPDSPRLPQVAAERAKHFRWARPRFPLRTPH